MRLAAKLCLRMGIVDVEEFMMKVPSRVLDFWAAFDRLEPIGDEWAQTALLGHTLDRVCGSIYAVNGSKYEIRGFESFMPLRWAGEKAEPKKKVKSSGISLGGMVRKLTSLFGA